MICMLLVAATTAASAYLVKPMLDDIFVNRNRSGLLIIPVAAILIFFIKGIAAYGQQYWMSYVGEQIIKELRNSLYDHIIELPISFFHKEKTGVLMSRITNDVNIVKAMVSTAVTSLLLDLFTVVGLTCVIFYMDWKLAVGAFLILPAAFYPVVAFGRRVRRFSTGCQEAMADLSVFLHETFSGSKVVKIFTREAYEKDRFRCKTETLFRLEMKSVISKSLSSPVMEFFGGLGIAFIIWFGGSRVISGESTTGTFFSFLTAVMMLYDPVKKLTKLNNTLQEGLAAVTRIYDIVERESEIVDNEDACTLENGPVGVKFDNVSFSYDGRRTDCSLSDKGDSLVLRGINLHANPGEVIALAGMSGGGKTSLVNLIPRFYDVTEGRIVIEKGGVEIDIRNISLHSLRSNISIVTQEPILFNETVMENIRYGRESASNEEVVAAARAAFAHDFIMGFPKGYDTVTGELGSRLSGGEKQRLCIARALIKDAPILILDEATSALDAEAEKIVQKALGNLMKGRTSFVIAHRLSTIQHANRVILINKGQIVEQGTHDELMLLKGDYFKLQNMQHNPSDD
ncbi:Lipid A export ATP-binding/permease protein MsbA [Desulfamplus magnetovallimortis]|uniref:Lipid A export ATP-binding/permease protein MsbA n=1 Tax=Desulfamplus magnetovallimortis TaxID=1246637 RepID=A0A1W1HCF2_9BACT|nr:ABC transporter ATP-binding protein [Desulfamplus magnetovallimortis]SLM30116.1 Lipid A export ATP-binding/permease protein MsbA [Desulfamplus magnetovallimortis]